MLNWNSKRVGQVSGVISSESPLFGQKATDRGKACWNFDEFHWESFVLNWRAHHKEWVSAKNSQRSGRSWLEKCRECRCVESPRAVQSGDTSHTSLTLTLMWPLFYYVSPNAPWPWGLLIMKHVDLSSQNFCRLFFINHIWPERNFCIGQDMWWIRYVFFQHGYVKDIMNMAHLK